MSLGLDIVGETFLENIFFKIMSLKKYRQSQSELAIAKQP